MDQHIGTSKLEDYVVSFNTEDISTAPSSEVGEPFFDDEKDFKPCEGLKSELSSQREHLEYPITISKDKPGSSFGQISADFSSNEIEINEFKLEEPHEDVSSHEPTNLKLEDFGTDSIRCVLGQNSSKGFPESESVAPLSSLRIISFPFAGSQLEKKYKLRFPFQSDREIRILTSDPRHNNCKAILKLFLSSYPHSFPNLNVNVIKDSKEENLLYFEAGRMRIPVYFFYPETYKIFKGLHEKKNMILYSTQAKWFLESIEVTGWYDINGLNIPFPVVKGEIGFEGIKPRKPLNKVQSQMISKIIVNNIDGHFPNELRQRVENLAFHIVNDICIQVQPLNEENGCELASKMKSLFIKKLKEYPKFRNYPDILYLKISRELFFALHDVKVTSSWNINQNAKELSKSYKRPKMQENPNVTHQPDAVPSSSKLIQNPTTPAGGFLLETHRNSTNLTRSGNYQSFERPSEYTGHIRQTSQNHLAGRFQGTNTPPQRPQVTLDDFNKLTKQSTSVNLPKPRPKFVKIAKFSCPFGKTCNGMKFEDKEELVGHLNVGHFKSLFKTLIEDFQRINK